MSPDPGQPPPSGLARAFGDPAIARALAERLADVCADGPRHTFMEVCGTHTMAIFRHGIRSLLPPELHLVSGPGCPVCVTPTAFLDLALALAERPDVVIATFGDLLRVPGSRGTLERARAGGADVRIVYSPFDAVGLAGSIAGNGSSGPTVVFLGVGFETTTPAVAQAVLEAEHAGLENFRVLPAHRRVVPALKALLASPGLRLDGFLLPGHVSVVLGSAAYGFLVERGVSGVVAGFEPVDILRALLRLAERTRDGSAAVENQYGRLVATEGNPRARAAMERVYRPVDAEWRGLGTIPESGLELRSDYARFDAAAILTPAEREEIVRAVRDDEGCRCGEVLTGAVLPPECPYFGGACTPEEPIGPCMVSTEGTCAAWYRYGERGSR